MELKKLQSSMTGWIHYAPFAPEGEERDLIPLYENGCFILSLFRSRIADQILEGKALLEKLLAFEVNGHFPSYLHEYPTCADNLNGLKLGSIFHYLMVEFPNFVGAKLEPVISRIIANSPKEIPRWANLLRDALQGKPSQLDWQVSSLAEWTNVLIGLQIAKADLTHILSLWHPQLNLYIGPAEKRFQDGAFPAPLDPFKAILIRPATLSIPLQPNPWVHFAPEEELPLYISWDRGHTLALAKQHLEVSGSPDQLELKLSTEVPIDDAFEVAFFLNYHPDHQISVEGERANTFQMGETVIIVSPTQTIRLQFESENGHFFGHILRGNRPSQLACRGKKRFDAYDWKIALRTISRNQTCTVRVKVLSQALRPEICQNLYHSRKIKS